MGSFSPRLLATTALLVSGPALAADRLPEVAVVGMHTADQTLEQAAATAEELARALDQSKLVVGVGPEEAARRLEGREGLVLRDMAMQRGLERYRAGRVLYERSQPDQAIPELVQAIADLEAGAAITGAVQDLTEAWLVLGLAHQGLGDVDEASEAFRQVLVLDPTRELDPINYPPKATELFNTTKAALAGQTPSGIRVVLGTVADEVWLDGRRLDDPRAVVEGLPPGRHFVQALSYAGFRDWQAVELDPGEVEVVQFAMDSKRLGDPADNPVGRALQTRDLYAALGAQVATPLVLLAGEQEPGRIMAQLYAPRSGNFSRAVSAEVVDDPGEALVDLMAELATFASEGGDIKPDKVAPEVASLDITANPVLTDLLMGGTLVEDGAGTDRGALRWVLLGGAGVVVAGGAVGGVLAAQALSEPDPTPADEGVIVFGPIP